MDADRVRLQSLSLDYKEHIDLNAKLIDQNPMKTKNLSYDEYKF